MYLVMNSSVILTFMLALNYLNRYSCSEIKMVDNYLENLTEENNTNWLSYTYSPVDLFYLSNFEEELFGIVKEYISKSDGDPEYFFRRYIADYEGSTLVAFKGWNGTNDKKKHFLIHANPLWSYRMIWRFVTDVPKIRNVLNSVSDAAFEIATDPYFIWPNERDLSSSMDSLLNLHEIYDLNLTEFANGIIANVVTNASLSAIHCFEISKHAMWTNRQYTLAIDWLTIAEEKRLNAKRNQILDFLEDDLITELLEDIIREHDAEWKEEQPNPFNINRYVNKIESEYVLTPQRTVLKLRYNSKGDGELLPSLNDMTAFSTLCKGGNLQSEKVKKELHCFYESQNNPAWYINPQKIELYNKDPLIFRVYDFIGDELMTYLKKEAIPIMERSQVSNDNEIAASSFETEQLEKNNQSYSKGRTSMYSWLFESEHNPRLPVLSQRIGYLTGLTTSWGTGIPSSSVQIAIYATGGYFNLHIDSLQSTSEYDLLMQENIGDRLATFMLYLNDVDHGGNTAFTSVGVAVPPVKGSAVFWYDSKYNGEVDYRSWHGVANKWIHNNLNIFKRICTLNKDE